MTETREFDPALPVLHLAAGLVGFPGAQRFALVALGEPDDGIYRLQCLDADLEFVVVAPPVFFPDYAPAVDDELAARLGIADPDDALSLVLVTVVEPIEASTANLMAPIIVNIRNREAAQVVLDVTLPLRRVLVGA